MSLDVSVVIPTFRRPEPLHHALTSALGQEGVTIEVIVLDDSPEGSAQPVVEQIRDPRVRYIRRQIPSSGNLSVVRNEGRLETSGRYVHFLDDDDADRA